MGLFNPKLEKISRQTGLDSVEVEIALLQFSNSIDGDSLIETSTILEKMNGINCLPANLQILCAFGNRERKVIFENDKYGIPFVALGSCLYKNEDQLEKNPYYPFLVLEMDELAGNAWSVNLVYDKESQPFKWKKKKKWSFLAFEND